MTRSVGDRSAGGRGTLAPPAPARFRQVLGHFATGVAVVSARAGTRHHAITANSLTSVSLDPPLVSVCVARHTRFHSLVLEAGCWGVSVLAQDQEHVGRVLSRRGRGIGDVMGQFRYHLGDVYGVLLLAGALATMECRTRNTYNAGDHTILLGSVVSTQVSAEPRDPLVYYRGRFGGFSDIDTGQAQPHQRLKR